MVYRITIRDYLKLIKMFWIEGCAINEWVNKG